MHGQWMALRSLSSDQSVKNQKLRAGTFKRILSFAEPYRKYLFIFITTVILDAILVVATPLLLRSLVDDGVVKGRGDDENEHGLKEREIEDPEDIFRGQRRTI